MKIIKLLSIMALCSVFNIQGMCRSSSLLKIRKPGISSFRRLLTEEERFFYRNQNELAISNMRVNEEKEKFYKEQAEFTRYKKNAWMAFIGMLVGGDLLWFALEKKDINGLPVSGTIISLVNLPVWLLHTSIYKNNELALKAYKERNQ